MFAKPIKLGIVIVLILLCTATATFGARIALFPLRDISEGQNGIDFAFTKYLASRLEEAGTETYPIETVIAFMANNRIRRTGEFETYYIDKIHNELGAAFVLTGTIIQKKESPELSLGVTLNLIRTHDARTIWSYAGAIGKVDLIRLLGIGQAQSTDDLQPLLADEILSFWPGDTLDYLYQEQPIYAKIASIVLWPKHVAPGARITGNVNFRAPWHEGQTPKIFFKVNGEMHAASVSPSKSSYSASWVAGEEDGRFPVSLVLEWPLYGNTETLDAGTFRIDGTPPLIALDLKGESLMKGNLPVFRDTVLMVPRRLVRKPINRWHISIKNRDDIEVAFQTGNGEIPAVLAWEGQNIFDSRETVGEYHVDLEVWDEVGNSASTSSSFALNRTLPQVALKGTKRGREGTLNLKSRSKEPLAYWRLELWSKEGKIIKETEGKDLPKRIGVDLPEDIEGQQIEGALLLEDALGNKNRQRLTNVFLPPKPKARKTVVEKKEESTTKSWVQDF